MAAMSNMATALVRFGGLQCCDNWISPRQFLSAATAVLDEALTHAHDDEHDEQYRAEVCAMVNALCCTMATVITSDSVPDSLCAEVAAVKRI